MKKTMLIAALTMAAAPAFASKARLNALQNAEHISDIQRTFDRPYEAAMYGEYATVEFGSPTGTPNAEGGFVRQMGEGSYLGLYLGHNPEALNKVITASQLTVDQSNAGLKASAAGSAAVWRSSLEAPLNIFYASKAGDITWGANLFYLTSNKKSTSTVVVGDFNNNGNTSDPGEEVSAANRKANVAGVSFGATAANWEADATVGLMGKDQFEVSTALGTEIALESNMNLVLRGAYKMDTLYFYGKYSMAGAKVKVTGAEDRKVDLNEAAVGIIDSRKKDGVEFFYGASYVMTNVKGNSLVGDNKTEVTKLPVIVGVEAEANSWLVLRGSLTQNLGLLGTTKTTTAGTAGESDSLGSTTVAAGAGMKFGKFTVDTTLKAATTGTIGSDGANFLGDASLTYLF
ncbi:MAG: hypothetical protein KF865_02175 [Bdellovibrionaceae bacterium]|nr:hypothetical protein [Pseudobdellovibrionaceae bacterium]